MPRTPTRPAGRAVVAVVAAAAGLLAAVTTPSGTPPPSSPPHRTAPVAAVAENTATVFYWTRTKDWAAYKLHYAPDGGAWTTVPGMAMEPACTDWVRATVPLGAATGLRATFNDGAGTWDNNGGRNYALGTGNITVKDGAVAHSDPCAGTPPPDPSARATVYYSTESLGWPTVNIHHQPAGGSWTTVPGAGMEQVCAGWWKREVDLGTAGSMKAAFNNGNGIWDNNGGADYTIGAGVSTVRRNTVTPQASDPCAATPPDTRAPTAPGRVTAL
ncbi:carbohydrate binding domain-containing protein, partial [Streptomyces sp.]